jgi:O-acetyl-ADP-ribose deacetylase (regulator of RNase III)
MSATKRVKNIELVRGDIIAVAADAIVNPSNTRLILGTGVSGAIAAAGGPSIQEEMSALGQCEVGHAVATGAGSLPHRYVIHTVGPRMGEGHEDAKLQKATESTLAVAEELGLTSVVFPAVSTGVFGFPVERCATVMLTVALDHYKKGIPRRIERVIFCLHTPHDYDTFANTLDWLAILP